MKQDNDFEIAYNLFDEGRYDKSFFALNKIANNTIFPNSKRAEAMNMLGVIVSGFSPHLSPTKYPNGVFYYKEALKLDNLCTKCNTWFWKYELLNAYRFYRIC